MLFPCLIAAAACLQTPVHAVVKVDYTRPSKIVETLRTGNLFSSETKVQADDVKSVVIIDGSQEDVAQLKTYVNIFDVLPRRVSVSVKVESPLDKISYQATANIRNQQEWRTSDDETGISIAIRPRINDDNTVTLMVELGKPGIPTIKTVFREKIKVDQILTVGSSTSQKTTEHQDGTITIRSTQIPVPRVTIRVDL
jgi:type II secretory pathway component GspD/PulD (secretin)